MTTTSRTPMEAAALRALLFVPGADERKLAKLSGLDADAVIVDFEDAVAESRKDEARRLAGTWLGRARSGVWTVVRVNAAPAELELDLEAVVGPAVHCIMLPKVESADALHDLDRRLGLLESRRELPSGRTEILALIETARGVVAAEAIAMEAPARLVTLVVGPADLAADLGLPSGAGPEALAYPRSRIVVAARAAGLPPALDGPYASVHDVEGFLDDSVRSRSLGFQGRLVLHPGHVEPARRAYGLLSADEHELSSRLVAAYESRREAGVGVIRVGDLVVDEPVYLQHRQLLERHRQGTKEGSEDG